MKTAFEQWEPWNKETFPHPWPYIRIKRELGVYPALKVSLEGVRVNGDLYFWEALFLECEAFLADGKTWQPAGRRLV